MLTAAKADKETAALVLKAAIGASPVEIPLPDMQSAVAPFYLRPREVHIIDLASVTERRTDAYWVSSAETIRENAQRFYASLRQAGVANIAIFALAPIPLLVALGSCLSNKYPTSLFQLHRDTNDWRWKEDGEPVEFACRILHEGTEVQRVALVCSLSGTVPPADYRRAVDNSFTVYEITPDGSSPSFDCLRLRESLQAFRACYRRTLQRITGRASRCEGSPPDTGGARTCSRCHGARPDAKGASSPRRVRQARGGGLREDDRGWRALGSAVKSPFLECPVPESWCRIELRGADLLGDNEDPVRAGGVKGQQWPR